MSLVLVSSFAAASGYAEYLNFKIFSVFGTGVQRKPFCG
jgi:hypothetical protein